MASQPQSAGRGVEARIAFRADDGGRESRHQPAHGLALIYRYEGKPQLAEPLYLKAVDGVCWPFCHPYKKGFLRPAPYLPNVDAVFLPTRFATKRRVLELRAGLGGARLHFNPSDDQACAQVPGCPASIHFQQHLGVAGRWYLGSHWFLRPAIDVHHVDNFQEFGSNWAPQYSVGIGYSLGRGE